MFHNMLMTAFTPLCNTDEINCWENRPFTTVWPETQQQQQKIKGKEITKTIKKKAKRVRTAYTTEQLRMLENAFSRNRYIDAESRKQLANSIKIGDRCVKIWFQNRRMKEKRDLESSCDSSSERFTAISPPHINQQNEEVNGHKDDIVEYPVVNRSNAAREVLDCQYPAYHYENYSQYTSNAMLPNQTFYYDANLYPTEYYPNSEDYNPSQYIQYNWPSNIFDANIN